MENANQPNWLVVAIVSSIVTILANYVWKLIARMIEKPKLLVKEQWMTKKGAKDDKGNPFVFVIAGIRIKNENNFWIFPRDTAEISETRIKVFDESGGLAVGGAKFARWWNYELADSDPLFPESYVIPQEENSWIYIPQATERNLILLYFIEEKNSYYVCTTSSHRKDRWANREEKIKGKFPVYIQVEIVGKSFMETKTLIASIRKNGELEINEATFPFKPAT